MTDQSTPTTPSPAPAPAPSPVPAAAGGDSADVQAQMRGEFQQLKQARAAGGGRGHLETQRFHQLREALFEGGPVPDHLRPGLSAEQASQPAKDGRGLSHDHAEILAREYAPAERAAFKTPVAGPGADLAAEHPEVIEHFKTIAEAMALPAVEGNMLIDAMARHLGEDGFTSFESESDLESAYARAVKFFGSPEAYQRADAAAGEYLKAALSQEQRDTLAELFGASTLLLDPPLIDRLARLAKMRGIAE